MTPTPAPIGADAALAQLRHLYDNLANGGVRDTAQAKRIAEGLLAPAIAALERAALASAAQPAVPPGWRLVPEKPTDEWISALSDSGMRIGSLQSAIRDMLAAAPKAAPDEQPGAAYAELPQITADDRSFLHYNPNTDDVVKWVLDYARAAITADRAMRAQAAPVAQGDAEDPLQGAAAPQPPEPAQHNDKECE